MKLGYQTNGISCEFEMQNKLVKWLENSNLEFKAEVSVKEVNRRADFLVLRYGRLINIEAKCNDFVCLIGQLNSHAIYCDYCFAYIPDYAFTPKWFKKQLAEKGYGLIIYNNDLKVVTEVLEAHLNKSKNKEIREKTIKKLTIFKNKNNDFRIL